MNLLDLMALVLIVLGAVFGFRSGALPQLGGLLGAIAGAAVAVLSLPYLADPLDHVDAFLRPFLVLAWLLMAVAIGESVGSAIGVRIARAAGTGVLGAADRIGGAIVGVGQAVLIVWLVGGLLALGPVPRLTEAAQTSRAVRALNAVLPPPSDFAVELGKLLDATGLPAVFVGFEPLPQPPVDKPDDPTARRIAQVAIASTVKVSAATCGYTSVGTGFAVARGYVVTNAHVVAGAGRRAIRVATFDGQLLDAIPVAFDPGLDIALLRVDALTVPSLVFTASDPSRGAEGATLGFPGGGPLVILPAAVTGEYPAVGRDIYDEGRVSRDIIELRAAIDRGDSGGPLILTDGTVGGVVFAEARTDPDVGYALSPTAVARAITPSIGSSTAVDTGACTQ